MRNIDMTSMKLKIFILMLLLQVPMLASAQVIFTVDGFSDEYYGKVYIADTSEVFSPGWIAIYEQETGKELICEEAEELTYELHDGKLLANIAERPYGEYSGILYDDFNFDGKKDFAIMDGQYSCYHGPSYQIYLATESGFVQSPEFTRLAHEYCGMFSINDEEKTLFTMEKDGYGWHKFSTFVVENNEPKLVNAMTEDLRNAPFETYIEEVWNGEQMQVDTLCTLNLDTEGLRKILSFRVGKSNKEVVLFSMYDGSLYYVLLQPDGQIEFSFPVGIENEPPAFTYFPHKGLLTFRNEDAAYTIYNRPKAVGIEITTGGKNYVWRGKVTSREGSLRRLLKPQLDNVAIQ
ncbi:XAC2610-related protein [Hoylesella marshii]|uniref:XAC2610-related protein n=1 Tax=Hoylesella marshii TaxID=189722 RepID=UPI0028D85020|nr:hypothetical protein [Hoylesella marshii]